MKPPRRDSLARDPPSSDIWPPTLHILNRILLFAHQPLCGLLTSASPKRFPSVCSEEGNPHSKRQTRVSISGNILAPSPLRLLPMFPPRLKSPFTRSLYLYIPRREASHSRMITKVCTFKRSLRLIPDWTTAIRGAHPQSNNCHYCGLFLVNNYHL